MVSQGNRDLWLLGILGFSLGFVDQLSHRTSLSSSLGGWPYNEILVIRLQRWSVPLGAKHEAVGTFGGWSWRRKMEDEKCWRNGMTWHKICCAHIFDGKMKLYEITRMSPISLFGKTRLSLFLFLRALFIEIWGLYKVLQKIVLQNDSPQFQPLHLTKTNHPGLHRGFHPQRHLRQVFCSRWSMVPYVLMAQQRIPWVYGPWMRRCNRAFDTETLEGCGFLFFEGVIVIYCYNYKLLYTYQPWGLW